MAVAFSPNYASNTAVLAAIYSAGDINLKTLITNGDATQEVFSSEIQDVDIVTGATTTNVVSLAFPSNYDPVPPPTTRFWSVWAPVLRVQWVFTAPIPKLPLLPPLLSWIPMLMQPA
jgi:hypothetical protein